VIGKREARRCVTPDFPSTHQTRIYARRSCYSGKRTRELKFVKNNAQAGEKAMSDRAEQDAKQAEALRKQEENDKQSAIADEDRDARKQEHNEKKA
jgi:hypothetical protein